MHTHRLGLYHLQILWVLISLTAYNNTRHYSPDTVLTVHASLPPLPLCIAVLYYAIVYSFQLQSGRAEPYGLVPSNLASQAWTSVLAWYTDHPVGGLRHPGTCLSRRAFPTILALQPQRPGRG